MRSVATIFLILVFGISIHGQNHDFEFQKRKPFKLDPGITSDDYYHGVIQVKLKPEYRDKIINRNGLSEYQAEVLNRLEIKSPKKMASGKLPAKVKARLVSTSFDR
jgi:hypothetical protein